MSEPRKCFSETAYFSQICCPNFSKISSRYIWFIGMMVYILQLFYQKYLFDGYIRKNSISLSATKWQRIVEEIGEKQGIKRRISVLGVKGMPQPCAIGFIHNKIAIPLELLESVEEYEIKLILQHEGMHLRRKDVVLKTVIRGLCCINWFNPFIHKIRDGLYSWTEIGCDEQLTIEFSLSDRKRYAVLLIGFCEGSSEETDIAFASMFGWKKKNILEKRVEVIMNKKRNTTYKKIVSTAFIVFASFTGTMVASAGEASVESIFSDDVYVTNSSDLNIQLDEQAFSGANQFIDFDTQKYYDGKELLKRLERIDVDTIYEIIDKDGNISNVSSVNESEPYHIHNKVPVNLSEHKKNSSGGCTTTIYEGLQCKKCDSLWIGSMINEITAKVCTH